MKKIYSKKNPEKLLHIVYKKSEIGEDREDIIPVDNFLQCGVMKMMKGKTFKPHKHIWKNRCSDIIAQESWVCIKGSVKCIYYDLDDEIIETSILHEGDCSFTLEGGHNYEILENDTIIYEFKTGPYEGQNLDKIFIENGNK